MSTIAASRRSSSSSSSATAKRPAIADGPGGPKAAAAQAKKRVALGNITNVAARGGRASVGGSLGNVTAPTSSAVRTSTTQLYPSRWIVVAGITEIHAETGLLALSSDPKIPGRGVG